MCVYIPIVTIPTSRGHLDHKTMEQLQPKKTQCAVMQIEEVATEA